ncbi:DUF2087 domain-containing protein [Scopulibacillus cellulosilyticus]|uniref:DUF2087 domain-containing protein n=1 Tax=Scopulibacillus cellulosilyticus TaxID=2665665 RepID=A0ABW2PXC2_9BACL
MQKNLFWEASIKELKDGFIEKDNCYICLLCGEMFEKGIIYPEDGVLYEAEKYMRVHIEHKHHSVFEYIIHLDKDMTGLSDHQKKLLQLFYQGKSDKEIQKEMGIGSTSTIRNHRHTLKKKERQAKMLLTLMELVKENDKRQRENHSFETIPILNGRYNIPKNEYKDILNKNFPEGFNGPLRTFNLKEKQKVVVLNEIAKRFNKQLIYTEKDVNEILKPLYHDYIGLRRYLVDYGFLDRKSDGSEYWVKVSSKRRGMKSMGRKKELKQIYKETETKAGVYQVKNIKNEKILIGSTMNIKTLNGLRFMLKNGNNPNKTLQKEWNEFGEDAFVIEVLEELKTEETERTKIKKELEKLEEKWLEKLNPYGERGYNRKNK